MHGSYYPSPRGVGVGQGAGGGASFVYANGHVPNGTPRSAPMAMNGGLGFSFQKRHERIDWRKMASVDVDCVMRELDFATLQDVIMTVTFCDIRAEVDVTSVDPNFIKLFRLSQLIAEYLLHSQNYLTHGLGLAQEKLDQAEEAQHLGKQETDRAQAEVRRVREECHKRKKLLRQQQGLIQAGANNYHKCPYCSKAFVHAAYLQSHLQRKHPEHVPPSADSEAQRQRESLEREVEGLKERLHLTESQMQEERKTLQQQMSAQKESLAREDSKKVEALHRQQMESWKQEQLDTQRSEMERMQDMFMKELKEMNEKYSSSQLALEDLQSKYGKKSNLGSLQDEDEIASLRQMVKRQGKENESRSRDLQEKLASTQAAMREQTKRLKEQNKAARKEYQEEMQDLQAQLAQSQAALAIERQGGNDVGRKYEKRIQQLMQDSKEQQKALKAKEKEIKTLTSRPPPQPPTPVFKPAVVSPPAPASQQAVEPKRLDLIYAQKSPAKPPPSPPSKKAAPALIKSFSSEEEEEEEEDEEEEEEEAEESASAKDSEEYSEGEISQSSGDDVDDDDDDALAEHELKRVKESVINSLKRNLEKSGVPEGVKGITSNSLDNKMKRLKEERHTLAKRHPRFHDIRKRLSQEVEKRLAAFRQDSRGRNSGRKQPPPSKRARSLSPKPKPAARSLTERPSTSRAGQPQPKTSTPYGSGGGGGSGGGRARQPSSAVGAGSRSAGPPPPVAPRSSGLPKSSSLKSGAKVPGSPARVSFDVNGRSNVDSEDEDEDEDEEEEEEEEESEEEEDDSDYSLGEDSDIGRRPAPPVSAQAAPQPAPQPAQTAARGTAEGMDNDSDWDSEEVSELEEASLGKGGDIHRQQQQQQQQQQGSRARPVPAGRPKSPAIAQKAAKIEQLLSVGRSDHKPVGGVDLGASGQASAHLRPDSRDDEGRSPSPRIPTLPDASDEDDDDSFAVSSLDGSNYSAPRSRAASGPVPAPRQGTRPPTTGSRKSDTDMSNTYGTSMWGSSKGQVESGTAKSSLVSVTDFDDDDLDLSDL